MTFGKNAQYNRFHMIFRIFLRIINVDDRQNSQQLEIESLDSPFLFKCTSKFAEYKNFFLENELLKLFKYFDQIGIFLEDFSQVIDCYLFYF
jgi:hypothetical protein